LLKIYNKEMKGFEFFFTPPSVNDQIRVSHAKTMIAK